MSKDDRHTFEVLWYEGWDLDSAPHRCIGRDTIKRRDLSAAIIWACNKLKKPYRNDNAKRAHGFYVRVKEDS